MLQKESNAQRSSGEPVGKIVKITGTVIDVQFPQGKTPKINSELYMVLPAGPDKKERKARLEVALQLGDDIVRCIAIENVQGISRNLPVYDKGTSISVPVGSQVLGRMFNVLGDPIDGLGEVKTSLRWEIHRDAPAFIEQKVDNEVLVTGIKIIDLMCPYIKGCCFYWHWRKKSRRK